MTVNGVLEIPEMSVETVDAFLEFLYQIDTEIPNTDSKTAIQLLKAGSKYCIQKLKTVMMELILTQPDEWFEAGVALEIYLFSRKSEGLADLTDRAKALVKL